ncbi:MAG: hypothetical protein Tsb0021_06710 [Chlamydiales bacterium]
MFLQKRFKLNCLLILTLLTTSSFLDAVEIERPLLHEAFISKESGIILLTAAPQQPPKDLKERIPPQTIANTEWIHGYWDWNEEIQDFQWVAGVWRNPPPGHQWVDGYWEQVKEGWIRIPGFWITERPSKEGIITRVPPDPIDEEVENPPAANYFWAPGYWEFSDLTDQFIWVSGLWQRADPRWIWVPPHYIWNPSGYIFIPGYWDWPLGQRGEVFSNLSIDNRGNGEVLYTPSDPIDSQEIIKILFFYNPDYPCFFQYCWEFYPDFWNNWCCTPPWWYWSTWWGINTCDSWDLWWWYCHPEFPHPWWMSTDIAAIMTPPSQWLLNQMQKTAAPFFITPKGMVSPHEFLKAIQKVTGNRTTILPSNRDIRNRIRELASSHLRKVRQPLRPQGTVERTIKRDVPKPSIEDVSPPEIVRPQSIPDKPFTSNGMGPPIKPSRPPIKRIRPPFQRPLKDESMRERAPFYPQPVKPPFSRPSPQQERTPTPQNPSFWPPHRTQPQRDDSQTLKPRPWPRPNPKSPQYNPGRTEGSQPPSRTPNYPQPSDYPSIQRPYQPSIRLPSPSPQLQPLPQDTRIMTPPINRKPQTDSEKRDIMY